MSEVVESIRQKYLALRGLLNESTRRRWAATEARALGWGGISKVSRATGMNPATIRVGLAEISAPAEPSLANESWSGTRKKGGYRSETPRVRAPGGGRKPVTATDPTLLTDLEALIEPIDSGDSAPVLRWTCQSTRELARELRERGHQISQQKVAELLRDLGFSLRSPSHIRGGRDHPDCDRQFRHLYVTIQQFIAAQQPVIVLEAQKEPLAHSRRSGLDSDETDAQHRRKLALGHAAETSLELPAEPLPVEPAPDLLLVHSIRIWWLTIGQIAYPHAERVLIAVAWTGSSRGRRYWLPELQRLADEAGLKVQVCHLPAGTRKWSAGEHSLRIQTGVTWHGQPRRSWEVVVTLLTSAERGDREPASLDLSGDRWQRLLRTSPPDPRPLKLVHDEFYGEWNYQLTPNS